MRRINRIASIAAALALASPAMAVGFLNPVNMLSDGRSFEVVDRLGTDTARIWCDAARAATDMGAGATQRLYVSRPYGPSLTDPGVDGISFTLAPSAELKRTAESLTGARTLSLRRLGNNMTVGQGNGYCVFEIDG